MKTKTIMQRALCLSSILILSHCEDAQQQQQLQAQQAEQRAQQKKAQQEQDLHSACVSALSQTISTLLTQEKLIQAANDAPSYSPAQEQADGMKLVVASIPLIVNESIYSLQELPDQLADMRKAINESANTAMLPDASYLIQIGAPSTCILDEDKKAKPLPEELAKQALALQSLTEGTIYTQVKQAGDPLTIKANITIEQSPELGTKVLSVELDKKPLAILQNNLAESAIPAQEQDKITSGEWLSERKDQIMQGINTFNAAAAPYIESREETARALSVERIAQEQLIQQQNKEEEQQAQREKDEAIAQYKDMLQGDKSFQGEWTREKNFGKITLHIKKAEIIEQCIHMIGTLYDTDLPEASLDIAARCDLAQADEQKTLIINIYDGQYDMDQATAEVYDAKDGYLELKLTKEGSLCGIMSCKSWAQTPEKQFGIQMSQKKEDKQAQTNQDDKESAAE